MKFNSQELEEPRLELTPLIDVIFQLLLFFMVTTTFAAGPDKPGLDISLPASGAPRRVTKPSDVVVVLTADGRILVNKSIVAEDELPQALAEAKQRDPHAKLILQADKRAIHGDVVRILDEARRAGLQVAIATDIKSRS